MTSPRIAILAVPGGDWHIRAALKLDGESLPALDIRLSALETGPGGERCFPGPLGLAEGRAALAVLIEEFLWPKVFDTQTPFDLVMPSVHEGAPKPSSEIVPLSPMRMQADAVLDATHGAMLRELAGSGAGWRIVIGPPAPPVPAANDPGARQAQLLRLKIWTLQQQATAARCRALGLSFLGNPVESRTNVGYLRQRYAGRQDGRANAAYGLQVLQQLARLMAERIDLPVPLL